MPKVLYIAFPENVAKRLTPGQIAAQAAHAATAHALSWHHAPSFDLWADEAGFGVTLVGVVQNPDYLFRNWQSVVDPYVHFLYPEKVTEYDVTTCYYAFLEQGDLEIDQVGFKLLTDEYLLVMPLPLTGG